MATDFSKITKIVLKFYKFMEKHHSQKIYIYSNSLLTLSRFKRNLNSEVAWLADGLLLP